MVLFWVSACQRSSTINLNGKPEMQWCSESLQNHIEIKHLRKKHIWAVVFIPFNVVGRSKDCFRETFRDASAVHNVPYAGEIDNLRFRELPRMLCSHGCDSFASAATRFASTKPCPVPSPLHILQASMSFRGKKLQTCFRELPRVGPEAHFTCLMSIPYLSKLNYI